MPRQPGRPSISARSAEANEADTTGQLRSPTTRHARLASDQSHVVQPTAHGTGGIGRIACRG